MAYGADGYATGIDPQDPDILYVTWQNGHLLRYDRRTREPLDIQPQPGPEDPPERWNWDAPLLISPHNSSRIYYGSQRVWRSDDRGDSWTPISGDLSRSLNRYDLPMEGITPGISALYDNSAMSWYGNTTSISESPLQEGLLYVGTDDGLIQVTEDGGRTWRRVDRIPGVPPSAFVNDVKASIKDPNVVFALFDNHKEGDFSTYVMKSTDRGRSWVSIAGDLPPRHIAWSLAQDHEDPELLFLGTEFGVYFTLDGGGRWIQITGGAPTIAFRDLEIQRRETDLVASSFGRGFFILDDYSPLRDLTADDLRAGALLFPPQAAFRYVPSVDLGVRGKGYQGSNLYTAPNPPFGAVFTYYLKEELRTPRQEREAREASLRASGENVPFPGWDSLRAEVRIGEPQVILTISDGDGNVVRRIVGEGGPGFHRVAFDLRYPSPNPVQLDEPTVETWSNPPVGPMVAPGTYSVELARLVYGELRPLAAPQTFQVQDLPGVVGTHGDSGVTLAFQLRTSDVLRRAEAAAAAVDEAINRLALMRKAVLVTPGAPTALLQRVDSLDASFRTVSRALSGDPIRGELWEPSRPSVLERVSQISEGHWWTTEPPTETFRRSLDVAANELQGIEEALDALARALQQLEQDLKDAGAPWIPGQRIG